VSEPDLAPLAGGPAYRFLTRARLFPRDAPTLIRIAAILSFVTWVPLLVLSAVDGLLLPGAVTLPFARDAATHVRFLIAVPVFCLAELVVGGHLTNAINRLLDSKIVPVAELPRFQAAMQVIRRRRDSNVDEVVLLVLAYVGALSATRVQGAPGYTTWFTAIGDGGTHITLPGWWYALVSAPLFVFLFLRWMWRGIMWAGLLARISRLNLGLVATHPDESGGIAFLGTAQASFGIVAFALSAVMCGELSEQVLYGGGHVMDHKALLIGFVVLALVLVFAPLLVLAGPLSRARHAALARYGKLLSASHRVFESRWLDGRESAGEELLGSADPSSLADVASVYGTAKQMRIVPIARKNLVAVVAEAALPMLPLVALEVPIKEIVTRLIGILA
jgi:hypothetical protein